MNSLKRLILILPIFLLLVLVTPLKVDAAKKVEYLDTKVIQGSGSDDGYAVAFDSMNNIYQIGSFENTTDFDSGSGIDNHTSNGSYDIFLTKINSDGTYGWTKTIGGSSADFIYFLTIDYLDNIYLTGSFQSTVDFDFTGGTDNHTSNGSYDAFVTKINSDGTYGYTKTFGGSGSDYIGSIIIDSSNNIYLTGWFQSTVDFDFSNGVDNHTSAGPFDIFLMKINSNETYGWTKTFGGSGSDWYSYLVIDNSNNIYLTGSYQSTVDFDFTGGTDNHTSNGSSDIFLMRINSDGTYGWTKTFGGSNEDVIYTSFIDNSNNIYLTGYFRGTVDFDSGTGITNKTTTSYYDSFVSSFDKYGNFNWVKTFSSNEGSQSWFVTVSNDRVYITGDFGVTTDFNPDGPSDIKTTDANWSAFLTTYQLYTPGVTITESSGTTSIVPNVSTDTVTVKLDAQPDSDVTVTLGSNDSSLNYSPSTLTFTTGNYSTPQIVTISSATPVGSNTTKNMTFILTSSDTDYNGLSVTPVSVGVNVDNSDTVAPSKVVITNLGNISNVPNKDILRYYFTSQTPVIKGTSESNSTVYFVTNGHTYSTVTGSDGKYTITLSNPSLLREKNVIVYYSKDSYFNKSAERTLELTVGEENFPKSTSISSSSSSSSETSLSISSSSSTSSLSRSSTSSASSSTTSSVEVILTTKEITIKDENGNILPNTKVTINGKTYTTDSKGKVKADVAGVYIVEYDKGGVKYSSSLKSSESTANLKPVQTTNSSIFVLLGIGLLFVAVILIIVLKRKKKEENFQTT